SAAAEPEEIVVRGVRTERDAAEVTVSATEGRHLAGSQGDPVKAVEALPGLARSAFGADELVLWGASPEDSRVLVDGVEIPSLFHGSGIRSTLHADFLQSVTLTPGAFGVDYGRAIGGLVRLESRAIPSDRPHGAVEASS